jgi:hypothetical protein
MSKINGDIINTDGTTIQGDGSGVLEVIADASQLATVLPGTNFTGILNDTGNEDVQGCLEILDQNVTTGSASMANAALHAQVFG